MGFILGPLGRMIYDGFSSVLDLGLLGALSRRRPSRCQDQVPTRAVSLRGLVKIFDRSILERRRPSKLHCLRGLLSSPMITGNSLVSEVRKVADFQGFWEKSYIYNGFLDRNLNCGRLVGPSLEGTRGSRQR